MISSNETIVAKFWISPAGILDPVTDNHQDWAKRRLRLQGRRFKNGWNAQDVLLGRGWIRVQVYSEQGLGLHGKPKAIDSLGRQALSVLPSPKRVYALYHPSGLGKRLDPADWRTPLAREHGRG